MKLEIIIPNFNGFDLIKKNFPMVLAALGDEKDIEIIIVDDGSKKEEQEALNEFINKINKDSKIHVRLLLFERNVGFSSNVNRAALRSNSDLLIFLNSDAVPEKGFLKFLLPHFTDAALFGVGMMDKSIEGEKIILRGRGITYWKKGMLFHGKGEVDKTNTSWVSGGSSIVRTELFKKLGGFDSLYDPFYWEDIDLSYVARKAGYKILFEPKSIIVHSHFEGSIKKHYKEKDVTEISYRNQLIFIWKNITDTPFVISHLFLLPYYVARALLHFDIAFLKGFLLAVQRLPDIMKHREEIKKKFKLLDKEIIP